VTNADTPKSTPKSSNTLKHLLVSGAIVIALTAMMSFFAQRQMNGLLGQVAPQFSLPTTKGQPVALQDAINGRKAVLVNFWFYS
jgi:hypothetical protein